ncbi:ornithine carbamoyltransferase [Propionicicella superfundia]|uniref:ornithine carbamoyltransferase n=1 Tax=Propionicicella superfundia TaxID=348582 RepID=UPI000403BB74|nr:ornithine carbamoyltransferase [Propionicicella superfundia]
MSQEAVRSLAGRDFLKETDFTPAEWRHLVDLTARLKADRRAGVEARRLVGRTIAVVFDRPSTRTRTSFEVAAFHQGAFTTYLGPDDTHLALQESVADTARMLGGIYDAIAFRGGSHRDVEILAEHAQVPVYNGLTDEWHPTQSLCDMFTMRESSGLEDRDIAFAFLGDARFNVARSLLYAGALLGMDVRIVAPSGFQPPVELVEQARDAAAITGARITVTDDVRTGVADVDFVHTDVWLTMGEPAEVWARRIAALRPYQVTMDVLEQTGNSDVRFMHCLPAYHDRSTAVADEVYRLAGMSELEVTDEVFGSPQSIVFAQSENRMHSIKAVLAATLTD